MDACGQYFRADAFCPDRDAALAAVLRADFAKTGSGGKQRSDGDEPHGLLPPPGVIHSPDLFWGCMPLDGGVAAVAGAHNVGWHAQLVGPYGGRLRNSRAACVAQLR